MPMGKPEIRLLVPDPPDTDALSPYLRRIDSARWYTNFGPAVRQLEERLLELCQKDSRAPLYLTTVSNCTLGLELALSAFQLRPGAHVLVPGLTFAATITAVMRAGLEPVIGDIDPASWLLTPDIARRAMA